MPDLGLLLRESADAAGERSIDIAEAIVRGEQLRRRRAVTRAGTLVAAVTAAALLLPDFGTDTVKFLPTPPAPAVGSPSASQSPETQAPRPRKERNDKQPQRGNDVRMREPAHRDAVDRSATTGTVGGTVTGTRSHGPARPGDATAPRKIAAASPGEGDGDKPSSPGDRTDPKPRDAAAPPEQPPSDGPPEKPYCDVYTWELPPGESDTCEYTATAHGGFIARNNYGQMYHPAGRNAPVYWTLEITRGSDVRSFDSHSWPEGCSDDAIQPGDIVRATVYRPEGPADDPWSLDLMTGKYRSCGG